MRILFLSLFVCTLIACRASVDEKTSSDNVEPTEYTFDASAPAHDVADSSAFFDASAPVVDAGEVLCGSSFSVKCDIGKSCNTGQDCLSGVCDYKKRCISTSGRSCAVRLGGDTCGVGEVGEQNAIHESCCRSLQVKGFVDPTHPNDDIYLDKYEITAGRMRAFAEAIGTAPGGVRKWVTDNPPRPWNVGWNKFMPSDTNDRLMIARLLLGDPRYDGQNNPGPGVIVPPATDQEVNLGMEYQFGAQVYVDVHGNNCGVFPGSYGFPTYYYPPNVLTKNGEVPRVDGTSLTGKIPAKDYLDVKAMNCVTNAMLQAFCAWDGGQLATSEVMDYITAAPARTDAVSGCGSQYDNHDELLNNVFTHTVQSGGRCPPVNSINVTFDAGDWLPVPGSPLNFHRYNYPDLGNVTSEKTWQIASPGRISADVVHLVAGDEGWRDIAGNLNEAVMVTDKGNFTGLFGLRSRGIGYGSSRSVLNVTYMSGETILRVQRPEVKSALSGGRCMRFVVKNK